MNPRDNLLEHGFWVARGVLEAGLIDRLADWSAAALHQLDPAHRRANRSQGSLINLSDFPEFAVLIGHPALRALCAELAFADPVLSSGYIISKPPQGPPLFWHQDWWGWDDPLSYTATPAQVFMMIYLTRTTLENGCLRVIPGSHRRRHPLHEAREAHAQALSRVDDPADPVYESCEDAQSITVEPGDVVVGDARLLHGAHANQSDRERTLLTLWFHPDFGALPAGMRARIHEVFLRRGVDTDATTSASMIMSEWPAEQRAIVEDLFPREVSDVVPHAWNRQPDTDKLRR